MTVDEVLAPVRGRITALETSLEQQKQFTEEWHLLAKKYRDAFSKAQEDVDTFRDAHAKVELTHNITSLDLAKKNGLIGQLAAELEAIRLARAKDQENSAYWKAQFQDVQEDAGKWRHLMADLKRRTQEAPIYSFKFGGY